MTLPGLFVTGTDTGVGKTVVASAIARVLRRSGRRVGVLKPVATGVGEAGRVDDAEDLIAAIGGGVLVRDVTPLVFRAPMAPVVAARLEGRPLAHAEVRNAARAGLDRWATCADVLIFEGVGGLLCPLAEGSTVADLAIELDLPLVIVARRALGTLNHTLLTIEAASRRGLRLAGVVLNGSEPTNAPLVESSNAAELARRLRDLPILANIPHGIDPAALPDFANVVDWYALARPARPLDR